MSERDISLAIATLVEGFHVKEEKMPASRVRIFAKALAKVPARLLEPMTQRTLATRKGYGDLPDISELLEDAEHCRLEMVRELGEPGCALCEDQKGWIAVTHADGVRMERCPCWKRLQQKRAELEVGSEPLALTAARNWTESEA